MITALVLVSTGCGMQVKFLPQIALPYISEVEFFKQVDQTGTEIKKIPFDNHIVTGSFYMVIKLENIENRGTLRVTFYRRVMYLFPDMLAAVERRQFRMLANLITVLTLPFYPNWIAGIIRVLSGDDNGDEDLISAHGRGCFRSALQFMVFPRGFSLGGFSVDRYEKSSPQLFFRFGEDGKYYEYIMFIDRIRNPEPGRYRYGIFLNNRLMLEDSLEVHSQPEKN